MTDRSKVSYTIPLTSHPQKLVSILVFLEFNLSWVELLDYMNDAALDLSFDSSLSRRYIMVITISSSLVDNL